MRLIRQLGITLAVSGAVLLGGCSQLLPEKVQEWTVDRTAVTVSKEGTVTETIIDQLNQDYYSADELSAMISETVSEYNGAHSADSITVTGQAIENGSINLQLTYQKPEDYADYNRLVFFNGSMLDAQVAGYDFDTEFCKVSGGTVEEPQSNSEALSHKELRALIMDTSHAAVVPGKIRYISANAQLLGTYAAAVKDTEQRETEAGLVLPSSAVYTPEESSAASEDAGQNFLYIIYEY